MASHRFRVLKLIPFLKKVGIEAGVLRFHPKMEYITTLRLALDQLRFIYTPRLVVFQKTHAFSLVSMARHMGANCVLDIDDGSFQRIDGSWYPDEVQVRLRQWYGLMDAIVASCNELREWFSSMNDRVYVIPTCVDTETNQYIHSKNHSRCVIGWVGSNLSELFLKPLESVLHFMSQYRNCETLIIAGNDPQLKPEVKSRFILWEISLEPSVFNEIDIGIMYLPNNNERARMKAGFKLLQYMAAGLPVVASPIGVNKDIVRHGWNGFLAETLEDWKKYLEILAGEPEMRIRMGQNGRAFVNKNYHLRVAADLWKTVCSDIFQLS
ncbi:MAG: glycosyltransferase family 4 protein [Thermodesulfobacteriota bacterium]